MVTNMLMKDKVCVVVGASSLRGIGYASAELLTTHGAKIVAIDLAMDDTVLAEITSSIEGNTGVRPEIIGIKCDIQSAKDCDRAIEKALSCFGSIDCLINAAGIVKARGILDIPENEYDRILNVNLKGGFNICRSVLRVFVKQQYGSLVNVASVAAQRGGGLVGGAHYAASKGGLVSLTKSIAREFGPLNIRANSVCPSMIETGMLDGNITEEQIKNVISSIPLNRAGKPSEIAGACLFLASDLSSYITGATIDVNGGSHIH